MKALNFILFVCLTICFISCNKPDPCEEDPSACFEDQLKKDLEVISTYIQENNIDTSKISVHPSGLHFIVDNSVEGDTAQFGQVLYVDYIGKTADGTVFDTSFESVARENRVYNPDREYEPFQFRLGYGDVIDAWDIAFQYFEQGAEGLLMVPSYLGYGEIGNGALIGENEVLIFEVKLVDVRF